jgi:hypothetical protein
MDLHGVRPKGLTESPFAGWKTPRLAKLGARYRRWLAKPRSSWTLVGIVLALLAPTLWSGLVTDDLFQRLVVERKLGDISGPFDLFNLVSNNEMQRMRGQEYGAYPWWLSPHTQVSYWRPLAALTHFIDYSLWPRAAWLMHLQNLIWYGGLILGCAVLYRRFIRVPWVAGVATCLYALDHAHSYPVAWICNRNALMSTLFGVLSLLAHDQWRSERRLVFGFLAWGAFALALLSAEAGLAIFGYTIAYAAFVDRGGRARAFSVAPYVLIVLLWRVAYRGLGHGVIDSSMSLDPLIDTGGFLLHALTAIPLLLASGVSAIPADPLIQHAGWPQVGAVVACGLLALFGYAVWPLIRRDDKARFFGAGAVISALPLAGSYPTDRYLFWAGIGIMGLVAELNGAVFGSGIDRMSGKIRLAVWAACFGMRGVISPAVFQLRATAPGIIEDEFERRMHQVPRGPDIANQTMVFINPPLDGLASTVTLLAIAKGEPIAGHTYLLYAGSHDVSLARTGPHGIEVRSDTGWLAGEMDRGYRNSPFRSGEAVNLADMTAVVRELNADGRPETVEFSFAKALDDPSLVLLAWGTDGFERVSVPPTGKMTLRPAELISGRTLRMHPRLRAIEAN